MHGRIYTLKNVNEKTATCSDEDTLFEYFETEGRGIDYVTEMGKNSFTGEIEALIQYFFDPIIDRGLAKMKEYHGKLFLQSPTIILREYVKKCIENYKESANQLSLQQELEAARYSAGAVERKSTDILGDFYDNLILDEDGYPRTFYSWALNQLAKNPDKEIIEYEVVQIFDLHY